MINFEEYKRAMQKTSNFAVSDNFDKSLDIIKTTSVSGKHKMLVEGDLPKIFQQLVPVYKALEVFDKPEEEDFIAYEKELWTK